MKSRKRTDGARTKPRRASFHAPIPARVLHPIEETAALLGCGMTTLYSEIKVGRIVPVYIGTRALFARAEIDRYVAAKIADVEAHRSSSARLRKLAIVAAERKAEKRARQAAK